MAKEYDIHFRQRLTECDLVFYAITYHGGTTVTNRLVLNAELTNLVMQQMFEAASTLTSDAQLAKILKRCFEQVNPAVILDADVVFSVRKSLYPENKPILLDTSALDMFATAFTTVSNSMLLKAEVTGTKLALSAGGVSLPIVINAAVSDTLKRGLLSPSVGIDLTAEVTDTSQIDYLNVDSSMVLDAVPPNLNYRLTTGGESDMQLAAMVISTRLLHTLGAWYNGIAIDARVTGTFAVKNIEVQSGILEMDTEVTDTSKIDYLNTDSGMVLDAVPPDLNYRLTIGCESEMQLAAMVAGTRLTRTLGAWDNSIVTDASVTGTSAVKNVEVQSGMVFDMDVECVLNEIIAPESNAMILGVDDIDMGLKRYRMLADLDDWTLEDMDDMTLDELDYVILA